MSINFFVELKYQSSTVILSVNIKYSLRDLFRYLNNCLTGVTANYYPQIEATPGVTTGQLRITPRVYIG